MKDLETKINNWIHEDPDNDIQIQNRVIVAVGAPVLVGFAIGGLISVILIVLGII